MKTWTQRAKPLSRRKSFAEEYAQSLQSSNITVAMKLKVNSWLSCAIKRIKVSEYSKVEAARNFGFSRPKKTKKRSSFSSNTWKEVSKTQRRLSYLKRAMFTKSWLEIKTVILLAHKELYRPWLKMIQAIASLCTTTSMRKNSHRSVSLTWRTEKKFPKTKTNTWGHC